MIVPELQTKNDAVQLVEPDIERDAALGVAWLNGDHGRDTLRSMANTGQTIDEILPTNFEKEAARVTAFIEGTDQLNWMIRYEDTVVGAIWVDLKATKYLPAPSVHIMIGDPTMRGKGIGSAAIGAAVDYLHQQGHKDIYSRHLLTNIVADKILRPYGFKDLGKPYLVDSLEFQNLISEINT